MEPISSYSNLYTPYIPEQRELTPTEPAPAEATPTVTDQPKTTNNPALLKATQELKKMQKEIIVPYLSLLNIQFVDLSRTLKELANDRRITTCKAGLLNLEKKKKSTACQGKEVINELSFQLHLIFSDLRRYRMFSNGIRDKETFPERLASVKERLEIVFGLYEMIHSICVVEYGDGAKCTQLKQHLDILKLLCNNPEFLEQNLQSLAAGLPNELPSPKAPYFEFYLTSLDAALNALTIYRTATQQTYEIPLKEAIGKLKNIPHSNSLIEQLNQFITLIKSCEIAVQLEKIILTAKTNKKDNDHLKALFESLETTDQFPTAVYQEMHPLIMKIITPWNINLDPLFHQFQKQVDKARFSTEGLIRELKKSTKKSLHSTLNTILTCINCDDYLSYANAFLCDPGRMPKFTAVQIAKFLDLLSSLQQKYDVLVQKLLANDPYPCSAFNAFDLLFHQIFKFLIPLSIGNKENFWGCLYPLSQLMQIQFALEDPSVVFQQNYGEVLTTANFLRILELFCKTLQPFIREAHSVETIHTLLEFLNHPTNLLRPYHFLFLLTPINHQHKIEPLHLPLIQAFHKNAMALSLFGNFDNEFSIIDDELSKMISNSNQNNRFFIKLSRKCVKVFQYEMKATLQLLEKYANGIQRSATPAELSYQLHCWNKESMALMKHEMGTKYNNTINILYLVVKKMNLKKTKKAINNIIQLRSCYEFFSRTFFELGKLDFDAPIRPLKTMIEQEPNEAPNPEVVEMELLETTPPTLEMPPVLDASYPFYTYLIDQLKLQQPLLLSPEEKPEDSYCFRAIKREEALRNLSYRLTALEEKQKIPLAKLLAVRAEADALLLLEATQKIVLCTLPIGAKEVPNHHIASLYTNNRPLLYQHNGETFLSYLSAAHFNGFEPIQASIPHQKTQLTKAFWFQEGPTCVPGIENVKNVCQEIWLNLSKLPTTEVPFTLNTADYVLTLHQLHKYKRKQTLPLLPLFENDLNTFKANLHAFIQSGNFDPECILFIRNQKEALDRVCTLYELLINDASLQSIPLCASTRFAEIQVSILSLSMQAALAKFHANPHPLFLDTKGENTSRPLLHTHRVDKILPILKEKLGNKIAFELIEPYLPLFVGDPRYPYPNKTPFTQTLVQMHQRVDLLLKFREGGFFTKKEQKTLNRLLGPETKNLPLDKQEALLKASIATLLAEQQHRTAFAFYLAGLLIES